MLQAAGAVRSRRRRDLHRPARRGAARAGPRRRPRLRAVQVVSGRTRADAGVPLAPARPRRGRRAAPIDLVVATKFPSYLVRHANKRVWLVHQFRQAYELDGTALGQFGESPEDRALRRKVQELDRVALGEATRLFATSRNVAGRLERSTGLGAEVLPHPPQELAYRCDGYGDFVLSVNRLDRAKRIDLLLEAARAGLRARGRDRRRRPGPRPARAARARPRARRPRALRRPRRRRPSWPSSTRAASPSTTRPSTRTSGWCPFEAFLSREAGGHHDGRRRPARGRRRRRDGARRRAGAGRGREAAAWLRDHATRRRRSVAPARRSPRRSPGSARSRGCSS